MRNLLPLCFVLGLAFGYLQTGFAQQADTTTLEYRTNRWSEQLAKDLNLPADKLVDFKTIHLDYAQQIQQMRKNEPTNMEEKRNKFRGLLLAQRTEIEQLLNDEQYELYVTKAGNWYRKVSVGE
jgi:hypothetical protein